METKSDEILELLRSKNRCLDRLMAVTRAFLSAPVETLVTDAESKSNPLTIYERARAQIIQTLELHDRTIGEMISGLNAEERTPALIEAARAEMLMNERLIRSVFNADDIVFQKISDAQSQIVKMIQENRKSRDLLGRFKSAQIQTGEGMDQTL